jgi:hypothetical protein
MVCGNLRADEVVKWKKMRETKSMQFDERRGDETKPDGVSSHN